MAYVVTVKCLVDTTDEASTHKLLNALIGNNKAVLDSVIGPIEAIAPEIEDAIVNETYEHGDVFSIVLGPIAGGHHGNQH